MKSERPLVQENKNKGTADKIGKYVRIVDVHILLLLSLL